MTTISSTRTYIVLVIVLAIAAALIVFLPQDTLIPQQPGQQLPLQFPPARRELALLYADGGVLSLIR